MELLGKSKEKDSICRLLTTLSGGFFSQNKVQDSPLQCLLRGVFDSMDKTGEATELLTTIASTGCGREFVLELTREGKLSLKRKEVAGEEDRKFFLVFMTGKEGEDIERGASLELESWLLVKNLMEKLLFPLSESLEAPSLESF